MLALGRVRSRVVFALVHVRKQNLLDLLGALQEHALLSHSHAALLHGAATAISYCPLEEADTLADSLDSVYRYLVQGARAGLQQPQGQVLSPDGSAAREATMLRLFECLAKFLPVVRDLDI
jgi:hypothetical protein